MRGRMTAFTTALCAVAVLGIGIFGAQPARAEVLWDQTGFDPWGAGFFNSESGSPPFGMTQFAVNDVTVDGAGWNIESITTYYSALDPSWGSAIMEGYLHIFDKVGPLPIDGVDDPAASPMIPMSGTFNNDHIVVTATGLNVDLVPGDYWIGITPVAPSGVMGPEIHLSAFTLIGDATAGYDLYAFPGPPAWFNPMPDLDATLLIEGTAGSATAVETATWGDIKTLFQD